MLGTDVAANPYKRNWMAARSSILYRTFQPQNISQNELYYLQFFRSTLPLNEIFNNSGFNQIFFTLLIKGNETDVLYLHRLMKWSQMLKLPGDWTSWSPGDCVWGVILAVTFQCSLFCLFIITSPPHSAQQLGQVTRTPLGHTLHSLHSYMVAWLHGQVTSGHHSYE